MLGLKEFSEENETRKHSTNVFLLYSGGFEGVYDHLTPTQTEGKSMLLRALLRVERVNSERGSTMKGSILNAVRATIDVSGWDSLH